MTLQVPGSEAGEVAIGQSVTLQLATDVAQNLRGRVARVSPAVSNGSVDVDVMPQGSLPADVRPNLAVSGNIHIADIRQTTYIQRAAYAGPESRMTLYRLVDDGRAAKPVDVRFGAASDQYIQVVSGLEPGDRVIVSDTSGFAGQPRYRRPERAAALCDICPESESERSGLVPSAALACDQPAAGTARPGAYYRELLPSEVRLMLPA